MLTNNISTKSPIKDSSTNAVAIGVGECRHSMFHHRVALAPIGFSSALHLDETTYNSFHPENGKQVLQTEVEGHDLQQWLSLLKTELESGPDSEQRQPMSMLQQLPSGQLLALLQKLLPLLDPNPPASDEDGSIVTNQGSSDQPEFQYFGTPLVRMALYKEQVMV